MRVKSSLEDCIDGLDLSSIKILWLEVYQAMEDLYEMIEHQLMHVFLRDKRDEMLTCKISFGLKNVYLR